MPFAVLSNGSVLHTDSIMKFVDELLEDDPITNFFDHVQGWPVMHGVFEATSNGIKV